MNELKQKLLDVCNSSGLPLEAILYVTKDLWRDVEDTIRRLEEDAKASSSDEAGAGEE